MVARFSVWFGAGVVTAGVTAAALAGGGVAFATDGPSSDSGGSTTSESSSSADGEADSGTGQPSESKPDANADPNDSGDGAGEDDSTTDDDESEAGPDADADEPATLDDAEGSDSTDAPEPEAVVTPPADDTTPAPADGSDTTEPTTDEPETMPATADTSSADDVTRAVADVAPQAAPIPDAPAAPLTARAAPTVAPPAEPAIARFAIDAVTAPEDADAPTTTAAVMAAPPPAPPTAFSLIAVIGSLIFSVYDLVLRLFEGPPVLPPGSSVTVRTSTLRFESGREIPANWYFPDDPEPKGLIYLQHGFLAAAPFYSYTAAALAERTNSIVVATSVTSNPFAADGFYLSGAGYQHAVASLFTGDRNELTESASAALRQDVTLPTPFVLSGHSAGGGLALAAASLLDDTALADLQGIVLLDGVAPDDVAATAFETLPDALPIYQLGAPPYAWNRNGATAAALVAARPGEFNGVELVGGSHVDSTQGGNFIFQIASYLATGFSQPQNIEAVKILAAGWINDMFDGTSTGVYGAPGDAIVVPTAAGPATAIVYPVGGAAALAAPKSSSAA